MIMKRMGKEGFSLAEVTMAVFVVSIGVVGMISLFSVGLDAGAKAEEATRAAQLSSAMFADMRAYFQTETNPDPGAYRFEFEDASTQDVVDILPGEFTPANLDRNYAPFGVYYEFVTVVPDLLYEVYIHLHPRAIERETPAYVYYYRLADYRRQP